MPRASQPKFNEEAAEKAIEMARNGNYRSVIARAAFGCHVDTFFDWLRYGRDNPEKYPHYAAFLEKLEQAEAEWEAETVTTINQTAQSGAPNTWQAGMTMLERKNPDRWGKRETRVIEGGQDGSGLPQINVLVLNDPDARRAHDDLLRSLSSASRPGQLAVGPGDAGPREDGEGRELDDVVDSR